MTKKLNEVTKVTTMNENDYAVLNTADGSTVQIKKSDLANALADVIPVVTIEKNGLTPAGYGDLSYYSGGSQKLILIARMNKAQSEAMIITVTRTETVLPESFLVSANKNAAVSRSPVFEVKRLNGNKFDAFYYRVDGDNLEIFLLLPTYYKLAKNVLFSDHKIVFEESSLSTSELIPITVNS